MKTSFCFLLGTMLLYQVCRLDIPGHVNPVVSLRPIDFPAEFQPNHAERDLLGRDGNSKDGLPDHGRPGEVI